MSSNNRSKFLRYAIEGLAVYILFRLFGILPLATASALGGTILGFVGPLLPVNKRAQLNLSRAMPDLELLEVNKIIRQMWRNLGRVAGEYPH